MPESPEDGAVSTKHVVENHPARETLALRTCDTGGVAAVSACATRGTVFPGACVPSANKLRRKHIDDVDLTLAYQALLV